MIKTHGLLAGTALFFSTIAHGFILTDGNFAIDIDPETLEITLTEEVINAGIPLDKVDHLKTTALDASWYWPNKQIQVDVNLKNQQVYFKFTRTRASDKKQKFTWYRLPTSASALYMPLGEGSHIPTNNAIWQQYLINEQNDIDTHFDMKLPLWSQQQKHVYSWILITPFNNRVEFSEKAQTLQMSSSHLFDEFNINHPFEVMLSIGNTPLDGAIAYRHYLESINQIETLTEKFTYIPDGKKLIGSTHVYVWGKGLLDKHDIKDWQGLSQYLQSEKGQFIWQKLEKEAQIAFKNIKETPPEKWQQPYLASALNEALKRARPNPKTPEDAEFLQYQKIQTDAIKENAIKQMGQWLTSPNNWGQGLSVPLINQLSESGLNRLWLGVDNWTVTFYQPQAVQQAIKQGYLIGSYDSYDTGIPVGLNDQWLTAQVPTTLREQCAIVQENGVKLPGFGGEGFYLNPVCMQQYSQKRIESLMTLSHTNSLFLDVDGTGMVRNDYNPDNRTSAEQMAKARNARLAWITQHLRIPLGSEDGNALTAKHLMFAHGMETWGFGWGDKSIHKDKNSPYYLGAWWPESEPATFFQKAKLKQPYLTVEFDPRWRLPMYQAAFHDAIISTHHWTYDNLKFPEVRITRELLSQLYNTAPLYNLSRNTLSQRIPEMIKSDNVFRPLHEALWDKKLIDFKWLDREGWVQQTTFSDGSIIMANFAKKPFNDLAPQTLKAVLADGLVVEQHF